MFRFILHSRLLQQTPSPVYMYTVWHFVFYASHFVATFSLPQNVYFLTNLQYQLKDKINLIFTVYLCIWGQTKWKESLSNREYTHSLILHLRSYLFWLPSFHLRLTIFWVQSSYGLIHVDVVLEKNIEKKFKKKF